ncbi:Eukaryotic aspartyl protease family protein [Striga hermonthica]|uniref:Eukaryotic aspartyl protease family protein n=1 Tax=Striga hermonthica TaxID=68872 RepID=A0A9N7MGD3_STRHE|nr:Eukaryotic aspartyl protease family protein [Striga hermonthica]
MASQKWLFFLHILLHLSLLNYSIPLDSKSAGFTQKLTRRDSNDFSEFSTFNNYFPNTIRPRITRTASIFKAEATIGAPPIPKSFIFDPGSDLTWTKCTPCINCFKQDFPLFDPKKSKTYLKLPSNHSSVKYFEKSKNRSFIFRILYGSGKSASGTVSMESFGFPSRNRKF